MAEKTYCPCCGEKVVPLILLNDRNEKELFCKTCGLPLEEDREGAPEAARPTPPAATPPAPPEEAPKAVPAPLLDHVVIAEDSPLVQEIVSDVLVGQGLARMLSSCITGDEAVARITSLFSHGRKIDLIILDVSMPGMNGVEAAHSLRALEEGMGRETPVPILFFTARQCDADFKQTLKSLSPAMYVNKGSDSDPEKLQERFENIIRKLMDLRRKTA